MIEFNSIEEREKERSLLYKEKISTGASKRKRQNLVELLRKQKRETEVKKRRNTRAIDTILNFDDSEEYPYSDDSSRIEEDEFDYYLSMINSNDIEKKIEGTSLVRNALAKDNNPPIQQVIDSGLVNTFNGFLDSGHEKLIFEAAWALTNIASGNSEQTQLLLNYNIPNAFRKLLFHQNENIREQAIWGLGNIAGESVHFRDYVLAIEIMTPVVENLKHYTNQSLIKNGTWALSNFCRGVPLPDWDKVKYSLEILPDIIKMDDSKILTDACWTLSYLSGGTDEQLEDILKYDIIDRLIELLLAPAPAVQTPVLRTIGNFLAGSDYCTDLLISRGVLPKLESLLSSKKKSICKETVWIISNLTAGTEKHIEAVLRTEIMPTIIHIINNYEFDIKREALWALSNSTSGSSDHVNYLVTIGGLESLCGMLGYNDYTTISVSLDGIQRVLECGELRKTDGWENPYAAVLERMGVVERLEDLQTHSNEDIYQKCLKIMERYLNTESSGTNSIESHNNVASTTYQF